MNCSLRVVRKLLYNVSDLTRWHVIGYHLFRSLFVGLERHHVSVHLCCAGNQDFTRVVVTEHG